MKPLRNAWKSLITCLIVCSQPVAADWYEFEVLVFARGDAVSDERPDRASDFIYPDDLLLLKSGPAEAQLSLKTVAPSWQHIEQLWGGDRHQDLYAALLRNQAELFNRDALAPWLGPEDDPNLTAPEGSEDSADANPLIQQPIAEPEVQLPPLAVERSYVALDSSHLSLRTQAQRLARSNHQVLWHTAWRQHLPDRARGSAIAVNSSAQPGAPIVLQGSLRISRARFLHLDTDLWLSIASPPEQSALKLPPPLPVGIDPAVADAMRARFANGVLADEYGLHWTADPAAAPVEQPSRVVHRLQQQRRARSEELHYLDHPRFGVLFIARPYQFQPWFGEERTP